MPLYSKFCKFLASGVFLTVLAMFGSPQTTFAQTEADQIEFGDWMLECSEETSDAQNCWLFQRLVNAADDSFLAEIRLAFAGNGDPVRSMLFMHAPPGILLTARPAYRVDDDETDIPLIWHNCTQRRCTAIRSLEIDEFDRLLAGGQIAIGYQRLAASQPTVFEVSLVGVTAGFDALAERLEAN
jgi:invasion protein IalB